MAAKLIGASVGPGDPELMTLQTLRVLQETPVIAYVKTKGQAHRALDIIRPVIDLSDKVLLELPFLMTKDEELRAARYQENLALIREQLDQGRSVAMINLGDISVYSTFSYMAELVEKAGYPVEWLPGVTSFCAGASAAKMSLAPMDQPIHLIPGSFAIEDSLSWPGTKVYLKSASSFQARKKDIEQAGHQAIVIEQASLPDQQIRQLSEVADSGYFSLIIVKETP